jgi:hypothetical protein
MSLAEPEIQRRSHSRLTIAVVVVGAAVVVTGLSLIVFIVPGAIEDGVHARVIGSIGAGVFLVAIGGGTIALVLGASRSAAVDKLRREQHPDAPWLWRSEWMTGRIAGGNATGAIVVSIFAVVWNAVCWPIAFMESEQAKASDEGGGMIFMFLGIGVLLVVGAVYMILRFRKYGRNELELVTLPGVIGGRLDAILHTTTFFEAPQGFTAALTCDRTSLVLPKEGDCHSVLRFGMTASLPTRISDRESTSAGI